jgi:hypothetical protein
MIRKIFNQCVHTPTVVPLTQETRGTDTPIPEKLPQKTWGPDTPLPEKLSKSLGGRDEATSKYIDVSQHEKVDRWLCQSVSQVTPEPYNNLTLEPFSENKLTLEPLCGPSLRNHIYIFQNHRDICTVCEENGTKKIRYVGCIECELGLCRTCYDTRLTSTHK